jgi:ADP-ribose pyrophosphatase YjhB (NUDIX family)/diadenosine tetraphosphate (Ap4A) HIT family hydrolase
VSDFYCDEVLSGRRPVGVVRETAGVLAFHHTRPSYTGAHFVVIPKTHVASLLAPEADFVLPEIVAVVREIAADVLRDFGACRVVTNLGDYQDSHHLHWHVVSGDRIVAPVEITNASWKRFVRSDVNTFSHAALPRRYIGAGAVITDPEGRVLLVKPTYKDKWEIPGGVVEPGEAPAHACERECREELGINVPVGRLLVVDHQSLDGRGDSTMLLYDGGSLDGTDGLSLPANELRSARFVHFDALTGLTTERLAARVIAAVDARRAGTVIELHGSSPRG